MHTLQSDKKKKSVIINHMRWVNPLICDCLYLICVQTTSSGGAMKKKDSKVYIHIFWTHSKKSFRKFSKWANERASKIYYYSTFQSVLLKTQGISVWGPEERPAAHLLKSLELQLFLHQRLLSEMPALQFKKHLFFTAQPEWPSPNFHHMMV